MPSFKRFLVAHKYNLISNHCHLPLSKREREGVAEVSAPTPPTPSRAEGDDRDSSFVVGMTVGVEEKLRVMVEHTYLFEKLLGEHKSFEIMKKHYKAYVSGFDGAKELRIKLMEGAKTADDVKNIVVDFLS